MAPKEPEGEDAPLEPAQKCLSCGAPRHTGQPCSYCNPAKPEPIATLETLDALAEAGENAYQSAYQADKSCAECRAAQVVAIIRAAQAYVDVSPSLLEKWLLENECDNLHCREILARMNSRIRYRVAVPSKTPKGLPTVDMIMSLLKESKDSRSVQAQASTILTALRPWLRDPVGWELPTFEEYRDVRNEEADKSQDWNDQLEFEYHWLRSRIRPTFECAECAKRKTDIKGCVQNIESAASFIRAALEGE